MQVRRAIATVAAVGMGLALTACGGQGTSGTPKAASSGAAASSAAGSPAGSSAVSSAASSAASSAVSSSDSAVSSSSDAPTSDAPTSDAPTSDAGTSAGAGSSDAAGSSTAPATASSGSAGSPATAGTTSAAGGAAAGKTPAWGYPGTSKGKKLGVVKNGSVQVTVYQVAITKATKKSLLVDATTKKPLIQVGDKIVWVNYVITNTSAKPIDLSYNLVAVRSMYPDWRYLSGMASITDSAQAKALDVHTFAIKPGSGDAPFVFAPGQSYAVGENFLYQGPKELDITVTVTPSDSQGKLLHDKSVKFEGSVKIS